MSNWSTIIHPRGVYTSPSFLVSNNLDRYVAVINETVINPHSQDINYYYRVSYNQFDWTDWEKIYTTSHDFLDGYILSGLYVQFQIVVSSTDVNFKPYIQSLDIDLKPYSMVENIGDLPIKPKIWIQKRNGSGDIALINHTTGQRIELKGLNNQEEVFIDCENEEIVSSNQNIGVYRYDSHNDEYLELIRGENLLTSEGDFNFEIRHKAKLLQE